MGLFGKKTAKTRKLKGAADTKTAMEVRLKERLVYRTLVRPHVTEKAHMQLTQNKYVLRVATEATKGSVKRAVEVEYGVHVLAVNIVNIPAQERVFRGIRGKKSGFKKAIVTLREGETISIFQGA